MSNDQPAPKGLAMVEKIFTYHPPHGDQVVRYTTIRDIARVLALVILDQTPESPEQTLAIRKLQEAVMFANAAIAINEAPRTVQAP
jgi:hypothetical protein